MTDLARGERSPYRVAAVKLAWLLWSAASVAAAVFGYAYLVLWMWGVWWAAALTLVPPCLCLVVVCFRAFVDEARRP